MEKAATACPLCHNRHHGLLKCGYRLHTVYVTEHNPEKAKTQLEALDPGKGRREKPGKKPSASLAQATPPDTPSRPAPKSPTSSTRLPIQRISEDVDKVVAAVAEAMEEEDKDVSGAVSLLDDEESLVEAGGILYQEDCVRKGN